MGHDERFDDIDSEARGIRAELKSIRAEVDDLGKGRGARRSG
jgi:hypothetical protein